MKRVYVIFFLSFILSCTKNYKFSIITGDTGVLEENCNVLYVKYVGDSTYVIQDTFEPFFTLYKFKNRRFYKLSSFGVSGEGPDEFGYISSFNTSNDKLSITDWSKKTVKHYIIENNSFVFTSSDPITSEISSHVFNDQFLFKHWGVEVDDILTTKSEVIIKKNNFYKNEHLNVFANFIQLDSNDEFLYVFFPNNGLFIIFDQDFDESYRFDISKIFKLGSPSVEFNNHAQIDQNRIFNGFFLKDDIIFFFKNEEDSVIFHAYDWKQNMKYEPQIFNGCVNTVDKFGLKYLLLNENEYSIIDIELLN